MRQQSVHRQKVSFRRDEISGSTDPQLISDWLPEIDFATGMEDFDHAGFVFDRHQMEFETLDSKTAKGILKIIRAELKRRIIYLAKSQQKNKRPLLPGRQIMFQICPFFNIIKTQGPTMNLCDLRNVELYNDNLMMFNQA